MNALLAHVPQSAVVLALLLSVVCWRVIAKILTLLAVGFVMLVVVGMAGYGAFEMLLR